MRSKAVRNLPSCSFLIQVDILMLHLCRSTLRLALWCQIKSRPNGFSKPLSVHLLQTLHVASESRTYKSEYISTEQPKSTVWEPSRGQTQSYQYPARSGNAEPGPPHHPDAPMLVPFSPYCGSGGRWSLCETSHPGHVVRGPACRLWEDASNLWWSGTRSAAGPRRRVGLIPGWCAGGTGRPGCCQRYEMLFLAVSFYLVNSPDPWCSQRRSAVYSWEKRTSCGQKEYPIEIFCCRTQWCLLID